MVALSCEYADFIVTANYDLLPQGVIMQAKRLILDLLGISMAGYKLMRFPQAVVDYSISQGGRPEATIIHSKGKYPSTVSPEDAQSLTAQDLSKFPQLNLPPTLRERMVVASAAPLFGVQQH